MCIRDRGEHKAAEYILKEAEQAAAQPGRCAYIQTPRMEFFQCPDFQQKKAELVICQPYEKAYPVRAYLNGACTPEEGITAPFPVSYTHLKHFTSSSLARNDRCEHFILSDLWRCAHEMCIRDRHT